MSNERDGMIKMNKKNNKKELTKSMIKAMGLIGVCTLSFNYSTQLLKASEINHDKSIATTYDVVALTSNIKTTIPENYVKANYKVAFHKIRDEEARKKDLSIEQAAELVARELWRVYQLDLEGKTIEMSISLGFETWEGEVNISPEEVYFVAINSTSGETYTVAVEETGKTNNNQLRERISDEEREKRANDAEIIIEKDLLSIIERVKQKIESTQLLQGKIVDCQYNFTSCSSFGTIEHLFYIKTDKGQEVSVLFSEEHSRILRIHILDESEANEIKANESKVSEVEVNEVELNKSGIDEVKANERKVDEVKVNEGEAEKTTYVKGNNTIVYLRDDETVPEGIISIDQAVDMAINALKEKYDCDLNDKIIYVEHHKNRVAVHTDYDFYVAIPMPDGRRYYCVIDAKLPEVYAVGCITPRQKRR
jgi:cation transport regulator ChaB